LRYTTYYLSEYLENLIAGAYTIFRYFSKYLINKFGGLLMVSMVFKALADPTRRKILRLLQKKDMTAGEIADQFNISKPSISHHLNILKQSGLVLDERKGQFILYSLNMTVFQELISWFSEISGRKED
jgi:DNA-binding transcriptional ArsR family regulator